MAVLGSSDNTIGVTVSTKADTKGVDDTSRSLNKLDSSAKEAGSSSELLGKAAGVAKVAIVALAVATATAGVAAVKQAAEFQQTRIGLENMLGSADAARKMLSEVSKFAADTPFEFPELAGAVKQLVAFGFSGEEAFKTMKQLGDVSAAVGAPIGDLSYLMGTLKTQGRAFTVDIRQFAQRGIPIYEYLAKVLNTNTSALSDMIEAGKVGFPEVQKAFELMTAEGGKFHGTMDKQSRSLSGLWSTLSDNIGQAGRELVGINNSGDIAEGSVLDRLSKILTGLITNLPAFTKAFQTNIGIVVDVIGKLAQQVGDYLGPKLKDLWTSIQTNLIPILSDLWHNVIEPLLPVIGVSLVWAIGAVVDIAKRLVDGIGWLYQAFKDGNPVILGLAGVFGTLAVAMGFNAVFNALTIGFNTLTLITIPNAMASFGALKALIMTPIVMPAIAVGAAIAALALVYDQAQKTLSAIDAANDAVASAQSSNIAAQKQLMNLAKNGSADQKARAKTILQRDYGLTGFASGGYTGPGGENEVAGIVHKGEFVVKKADVDQSTGKPKRIGGDVNVVQNIYNQVDYNKGIAEIGFRLRTT
jgi:hypothetical protein